MTGRSVWAFTPAFRQLWDAAEKSRPAAVDLLTDNPLTPEKKLLQFRQLRKGRVTAVTLFDVGRLPDGDDWRYTQDVVSKSGANPLRGLGSLLKEPFVDVSRLYHCPAGHTGITVTALGRRYAGNPNISPACGELHHLAILAHAAGLNVTAVIVAAKAVPALQPEDFLAG